MSVADPVAELLSDPRFRGKPITWAVTPESYDAIRRAWLTHVLARLATHPAKQIHELLPWHWAAAQALT